MNAPLVFHYNRDILMFKVDCSPYKILIKQSRHRLAQYNKKSKHEYNIVSIKHKCTYVTNK